MKIGFIGAGKMAQAIAVGLVKRGGMRPGELTASAPRCESLDRFRGAVGSDVFVTSDNLTVVQRSDVIFLAIKPQIAGATISELKKEASGKLFISVMAGVGLTRIEEWLGKASRVVRTMPNTPCLIGEGVIAMAPGSGATPADLATVADLLRTTGTVVTVAEADLDAVTSLSGSGPAYVYHFIEELIRAGTEQGLSEELSRQLAIQTVLGATLMVQRTGETPAYLAAQVKSPKGTTAAACELLESRGWGTILREAVAAARQRARELS